MWSQLYIKDLYAFVFVSRFSMLFHWYSPMTMLYSFELYYEVYRLVGRILVAIFFFFIPRSVLGNSCTSIPPDEFDLQWTWRTSLFVEVFKASLCKEINHRERSLALKSTLGAPILKGYLSLFFAKKKLVGTSCCQSARSSALLCLFEPDPFFQATSSVVPFLLSSLPPGSCPPLRWAWPTFLRIHSLTCCDCPSIAK